MNFSGFRRHSDDPLISGTIDDNQNEFDSIPNCESLPVTSSTISAYKKPIRTRKTGHMKLRFHNQNLFQECLDNYDSSQNHVDQSTSKVKRDAALSSTDDPSHEQRINESVHNWLQKMPEFQDDKLLGDADVSETCVPERKAPSHNSTNAPVAPKKSGRMVTYKDLPYMGEMTLDNSKPRRGRKPKKADICHLIYKNYGTVFPKQPDTVSEADEAISSATEAIKSSTQSSKAANSLLEKRLTLSREAKNNKRSNASNGKGKALVEEPLNLCVRDRSDCDQITVSSDDENEIFLDSLDPSSSSLFSSNLKMALPNFQSALLDNKLPTTDTNANGDDSMMSNRYLLWPNSNAFVHPMAALYLQKISDASNFAPDTATNSFPMASLPSNVKTQPKKDTSSTSGVLVPRKISQLVKENVTSANSPASANAKSATQPKRKRSAIFIPPMPDEPSSSHATEVSICKFKFTGGAKPSLQEKKMLSVDAGGNFRYYSGTGDKSIRGYEFFPRESLQQSSLTACSSAGAFLNTAGRKITAESISPLMNTEPQLQEVKASNNIGLLSSATEGLNASHNNSNQHHHHHRSDRGNHSSIRKRKSKRSMQREKLEKTFKEKGFLIQTQQLESAEGATYCKFRQLRKFTRYLFRSWKDYLPGELQQNQGIPVNPTMHPCIDNLDTSNFLSPSPNDT